MINEAIILAGGLGTRLKSVVSDVPKPMAPIQGKPFLEHLLLYLEDQGIENVILSVGHQAQIIKDHFGQKWNGLNIEYVLEDKPLGTGGAIRFAIQQSHLKSFPDTFILNGDSIFALNYQDFSAFHESKNSNLSLSAREVEPSDRYGQLILEEDQVTSFSEKKGTAKTTHPFLINAGVYAVNKEFYLRKTNSLPERFSFEMDFMPRVLQAKEQDDSVVPVYAFVTEGFFLDIGIPADFQRAQGESFFK